MRIVVDLEQCLGYANCVADAPDIFEIPGDAMVVRVLVERPSEARRAAVESAALDCPARAITVHDT